MTEQAQEQHYEEPEAEAVEPTEVEQAEGETQNTPAWSEEDAEEARTFGWKAPDEWRGEKPSGYIDDPTKYLERISKSKPFQVMQTRLEQQQEEVRKISTMNQRALEMQRQQYEAQVERLKAQQLRAVETGNVEAYKSLTNDIEGLQKNLAPQEPEQKGPDPYVQQYSQSEEGKWVNDPTLRAAAAQIIDMNPHVQSMPPEQQIAYARAEMAKLYPHVFQPATPAPAKQVRSSPVEGGSLATSRDGSGFNKLPAEARATFKRFVAQGLFSDDEKGRKAYVEDYNNA